MASIKKGDTLSFMVDAKMKPFEVVSVFEHYAEITIRSLDLEMETKINKSTWIRQKEILNK